jgi:hypothetical protein
MALFARPFHPADPCKPAGVRILVALFAREGGEPERRLAVRFLVAASARNRKMRPRQFEFRTVMVRDCECGWGKFMRCMASAARVCIPARQLPAVRVGMASLTLCGGPLSMGL